MPNPLRRLILLDRGTNHPTHPRCPIPCRGGSCGRPPGLGGAGTTSALQPRLPRAPTRGAPTGGRPPGLGRGNHICVATTPPQGAHKRRPYRWPPAGAGGRGYRRRLIPLDRGTNHPTHPRCPIPCDDLSCWIAVLTTPHTYDAQSPVGAALVAARRGWGAGTTSALQPRLPRAPTRGAPTGGRPPGLGDAATADGLSRWIAVLTTPHLPNAQSPVGAALVAARRGLGRGNHISVATTPPQGAHEWPPAGVGTPLQVAADRMFGVQ